MFNLDVLTKNDIKQLQDLLTNPDQPINVTVSDSKFAEFNPTSKYSLKGQLGLQIMAEMMDAKLSASDSVTISSKLGAIILTEVKPEDFLTAIRKRLVMNILYTASNSPTAVLFLPYGDLRLIHPVWNWPFWENWGTDKIYSQCTSRGDKTQRLPAKDVKDNDRGFIMTSFQRHICPAKTSVLQLSGNSQFTHSPFFLHNPL